MTLKTVHKAIQSGCKIQYKHRHVARGFLTDTQHCGWDGVATQIQHCIK